MAKAPVSVVVLTYNEEIHIGRLLKNISDWADEIFIADSFSTDKTLEIARSYGVKIVQHKFENQASQFNWALDNLEIKNDWILRLDADEYLIEDLKKEIGTILPKTLEGVGGFYIKRRVYFMGRWIRHGAYYPVWFLRLFRKGGARSEQRAMDEHIVLLEGKAEKLKNDFVDENLKGLRDWVDKHNNYASREAEEALKFKSHKSETDLGGQAGRKRWLKNNFYYRLPLFLRACLYFCYRYFIRLGFLDSQEGMIFHFLHAFWYRFLVDAKIYEARMVAKNNYTGRKKY